MYRKFKVGRARPLAEPSDVPARNATHPPATLARSDCGLGSVAGGRAAHPRWKRGKPEGLPRVPRGSPCRSEQSKVAALPPNSINATMWL